MTISWPLQRKILWNWYTCKFSLSISQSLIEYTFLKDGTIFVLSFCFFSEIAAHKPQWNGSICSHSSLQTVYSLSTPTLWQFSLLYLDLSRKKTSPSSLVQIWQIHDYSLTFLFKPLPDWIFTIHKPKMVWINISGLGSIHRNTDYRFYNLLISKYLHKFMLSVIIFWKFLKQNTLTVTEKCSP